MSNRSEIYKKIENILKSENYPEEILFNCKELLNCKDEKNGLNRIFILKDIIEFIIKFYTFLEIMYIYTCKDKKDEVDECIKKIFHINTWGKWKTILDSKKLSEFIGREIPSLNFVLEELKRFCKETKIIEWRNEKVHGDLYWIFLDNVDNQESSEIDNIIEKLCDFLNKIEKVSKNIKIDQGKELRACIDKKEFSVCPLMFYGKGRILFLYDSYDGENIKYLNHQRKESKGIPSKYCKEEFSKFKLRYDQENYLDGNIDQTMIIRGLEREVNRIHSMRKYIENKKISGWFRSNLHQKNKGVFLLEMERGMGKTAFVASIDQMLKQGKPDGRYSDSIIRCYYCNKLQYRSVTDFLEFFNSAYFEFPDSNKNFHPSEVHERRPVLSVNDKEPKKAMAYLLNYIKRQYKNPQVGLENKKLVLVIDGMDEVVSPEVAGHINLFHYIPDVEDLEDGIFVLITCRSYIEDMDREEETISRFVEESLREIQFTDKLKIKKEDDSHQKVVHQFIKQYFKHPSEEEIHQIASSANYSFVELKLYANLVENSDEEISVERKPEELFDIYFEYMERKYSRKKYKLLRQIMAIITYAYCSLNVGEIRRLCTNAEFDTSFINILKDLEPFIFYGRSERFTVLNLNNMKYSKELKEEFYPEIVDLVRRWIFQVKKSHEGLEAEDYKGKNKFYDDCDYSVQSYLHTYLYDYVIELHNHELKKEITTEEFISDLGNYEGYRNSINYGVRGVQQDVKVCSAAIQLMEDRRELGLSIDYFQYCKMFNDRAYLNNFLHNYKEVDADAQYVQKFLKEHINDSMDEKEKERLLELEAKSFNNIGSYEYQNEGNMEVAIDFFQKALQIRLKLKKMNFEEYAESCLLLYVNLLSVCVREQNLAMGQSFYRKGIKLVKDIKSYIQREKGQDPNERLTLNSYRKHRVEYGYAFFYSQLKRQYALLIASSNIDKARDCFLEAIENLEAIYRRDQVAQVKKNIIIYYYELAKLYQKQENNYLRLASEKIEQFLDTGRAQNDSRYADVYYRRYIIEKLNNENDKDKLKKLLQKSKDNIDYLDKKSQEHWLSHEKHMKRCIESEFELM